MANQEQAVKRKNLFIVSFSEGYVPVPAPHRIVLATSAKIALSRCASVKKATPKDIASLMQDGVKIEEAE